MHTYRKVLFPALREKWFVRGHRRIGHKVLHFSEPEAGRCYWRCYWRCNCGVRHRC